jgi:alpha-amylase
MQFFATIIPLILSITPSISAADTGSWKSRSIYFVLTDRITRSSSDTTPCANLGNYCGGTFRGLESKLDYIKDLGFDAVWITPVVASEKHFITERT